MGSLSLDVLCVAGYLRESTKGQLSGTSRLDLSSGKPRQYAQQPCGQLPVPMLLTAWVSRTGRFACPVPRRFSWRPTEDPKRQEMENGNAHASFAGRNCRSPCAFPNLWFSCHFRASFGTIPPLGAFSVTLAHGPDSQSFLARRPLARWAASRHPTPPLGQWWAEGGETFQSAPGKLKWFASFFYKQLKKISLKKNAR